MNGLHNRNTVRTTWAPPNPVIRGVEDAVVDYAKEGYISKSKCESLTIYTAMFVVMFLVAWLAVPFDLGDEAGLHSFSSQRSVPELALREASPVTPALFSAHTGACDSMALHATGRWVTQGARFFDAAARAGERRARDVALADAMQFSGGARGDTHDFVQSCLRSAIGVDKRSNFLFARTIVRALDPPENENRSEAYRGGYALARATALGGEPIVRFQDAADPRTPGMSVLHWDVGTGVRVLGLMTEARRTDFLNQSCVALDILGLRDVSLEDCTASAAAFARWLVGELADTPEPPSPFTYEYLHGAMDDDVRSRVKMGGLIGPELLDGFLNGMIAALYPYREFLGTFDLDAPAFKVLPHWTQRAGFLQALAARLGTEPAAEWVRFLRLLVLLDGMSYTTALLHPELEARPDAFMPQPATAPAHGRLGHPDPNGAWLGRRVATPPPFPAWVLDTPLPRRPAPAQRVLREEPSMTELMQSRTAELCMWLAGQHLPVHAARAYRDATLSPARQTLVRDVWVSVAEALVGMVYRSQLSAEGKTRVIEKIAAMRLVVGAPEPGPDELPLGDARGAGLLETAFRARAGQLLGGLVLAARGATRTPLYMPTHVPNAYYDPASNSFTVLAGIAQAPFVSDTWSRAALYGMLGAVIGHEMVHGLDRYGVQFDKHGGFHAVLPEADRAAYDANTRCFLEQYAAHPTPRHGNAVDAQRCIGEIVADNVGTQAALLALEHVSGGAISDGELREFVESYVQMWAEYRSGAAERARMAVDVHPPANARQDGTLRNLYDGDGHHVMTRLYRCNKGTPMRPEKTCLLF